MQVVFDSIKHFNFLVSSFQRHKHIVKLHWKLEKPAFPFSYIINSEPNSEPGEHWIAVYFDKHGLGKYFDSYGPFICLS